VHRLLPEDGEDEGADLAAADRGALSALAEDVAERGLVMAPSVAEIAAELFAELPAHVAPNVSMAVPAHGAAGFVLEHS
jgi:hypothetical protein